MLLFSVLLSYRDWIIQYVYTYIFVTVPTSANCRKPAILGFCLLASNTLLVLIYLFWILTAFIICHKVNVIMCILIRERLREVWQTHRRKWPEDRDRNWREAQAKDASQPPPGSPAAGGGTRCSLRASRGTMCLLTPCFWTSSLPNWDRIHFCRFKPQSGLSSHKKTNFFTTGVSFAAFPWLLKSAHAMFWNPVPCIPKSCQGFEVYLRTVWPEQPPISKPVTLSRGRGPLCHLMMLRKSLTPGVLAFSPENLLVIVCRLHEIHLDNLVKPRWGAGQTHPTRFWTVCTCLRFLAGHMIQVLACHTLSLWLTRSPQLSKFLQLPSPSPSALALCFPFSTWS